MSAPHDFELSRYEKKISELNSEQENIAHQLMRARRDEQSDLDRVRRDYEVKIGMMAARQQAVLKELKDTNRDLERLRMRIEDEKSEKMREEEVSRHRSRLSR